MGDEPKLVILGVSGAGKSQVARAISPLLNAPVKENSALAEERLRQPIATAMTDDPERALEVLADAATALLETGGEGAGCIVTISPSAILIPSVRGRLEELRRAGVPIVALTAPLDVLVRRTGLNAPQPVPLGQPRAWFRAQLSALQAAYSEVTDLWWDTNLESAQATATSIVATLGSDKL